MNKNVLIIVGIVLALGLGYFFLGNQSTVAPEPETDVEDAMMEGDAMEGSEDAAMQGDAMEGDAMEGDAMEGDAMMEEADVVVSLEGSNFEFSQEEITVNEGDTVQIELTATEGMHDWVVDEFDAATEVVQAGDTTTVTFTADQTGEFEYYCSVGNHRQQGMVGTLIVE